MSLKRKLSIGILICSFYPVQTILAESKPQKSRPSSKLTTNANKDAQDSSKTDGFGDEATGKLVKNIQKKVLELPWLPDWPSPEFDFYLSPILSYSSSSTKDESGKTTKISSGELGLAAGLSGVPIVPGNKGAYISPFATYAFGKRYNTTSLSIDEPFIPESYKRTVYGAQLGVLLNFYRHQFTLAQGRFLYEKNPGLDITSTEIGNDFGVLLLPFISAHFTNTYINAYHDRWSDPTMVMIDNWLHGRISTSFLNFFLDFGPGVMFIDSYESVLGDTGILTGDTKKTARSRVEYFKALTGLHLFWKLGMWGEARYIYRVSEANTLDQDPLRLPKEELNSTRSVLNQDKDTFKGNLFFGLDNIIYGMGLGWQYNVQIDHFFYSKQHKIRRNYGFGVSYHQSF